LSYLSKNVFFSVLITRYSRLTRCYSLVKRAHVM